MSEVLGFAQRGGLILGICNGFQILTECALLPGTLLMNSGLNFLCQHQPIRVESTSAFTDGIPTGTVLDIPIAHKEGNYFCDDNVLNELQTGGRIIFRYCDTAGNVTMDANPNGSRDNIAGICDSSGRILGMMPHPERAATHTVTSQDGQRIFDALERHFGRCG